MTPENPESLFASYKYGPQEFVTPSTNEFEEILIFGAGARGRRALKLFLKTGRTKVLCFIDDNKLKQKRRIKGVKVLSVSESREQYPDRPVVIACAAERAINAKIRGVYPETHFFRESWPDISTNLKLLSDQISRNVIQQHDTMLRKGYYIKGFSRSAGGQFWHTEVHPRPGDKIIAIGPYYGKPLELFAKLTQNDFEAHCFEANTYVYSQLCKNLVTWGIADKVVPVGAGVWSKSGIMAFASGGHTGGGDIIDLEDANASSQTIDMALFAYTIDEYVSQSGFVPTLIESGRIGIAPHVLEGAKETLSKHKPRLIFLDYPHTDALEFLKEIVPEYRIFYSEVNRIKYGVFYATAEAPDKQSHADGNCGPAAGATPDAKIFPDIKPTREILANQISKDAIDQHDQMLRDNVYIEGFSAGAGSLYQHPEVMASPGEKILSIGTFEGAHLRLLNATTKGDFEAHCLEPNPLVYPQLCKNIIAWGLKGQVVPVCAGAWSKSEMVAFAGDGKSGFIHAGQLISLKDGKIGDGVGIDTAQYVYSIDDYVEKTGFLPTLIESGRIGVSLQVLRGGKETIQKHRPKLILVDYPHSESAAYIKELVPDYEIYYSECGRREFGAFFASLPRI